MKLLRPFLIAALAAAALSCAGKKTPLMEFSERQKARMAEGSAYQQADFDFWAASYEPARADLENLRASWVRHGEAFPESKGFIEIEKEVSKAGQKTALIALFMTS